MTIDTVAKQEDRMSFFRRTAKLWQNYFDVTGLLPGINPSEEQKSIIQQDVDQLLIHGSAGSGKSITLMYKLLKVMKQEKERKRILYVTFGKTLVQDSYKRLQTSEEFQQLEESCLHDFQLHTFHWMAYKLLDEIKVPSVKKIDTSLLQIKKMQSTMVQRMTAIRRSWMESSEYARLPLDQRLTEKHTAAFLAEEITWIKANGLIQEEDYLQVERTGRSQNPRLLRQQRKSVFRLYQIYQERLATDYHLDMDLEDYALYLLKYQDHIPDSLKYDYVFVDEVQDLQPMQILALVKLTKKGIVLTGDPKQRIYKSSPHTYSSLGLQVTGRKSRVLKENFRSTRQIMSLAGKLTFEDVENDRDNLVYVREGNKPVISYHAGKRNMVEYLIKHITKIYQQNPKATVAVIHRLDDVLHQGQPIDIVQLLKRSFSTLTTEEYYQFRYDSDKKPIFFTDVYSVKGLEFDHVFVIQFDRDHYPLQSRIKQLESCTENVESETFERDLNRLRSDEKKLLYVAMTRAKHTLELLYYGNSPLKISQFIRDFQAEGYEAIGFDPNKYRK